MTVWKTTAELSDLSSHPNSKTWLMVIEQQPLLTSFRAMYRMPPTPTDDEHHWWKRKTQTQMQVDWIDHVKERNGKKIGKWRIWTCNHFPLDFRCFVDEIVHHLTKRISTARFCTSGQTFSLLVLRSSSESTKKLWIIKSSSMPQNMTLQTRHCWNLQDRAPCRHFNILSVLQIVSCQTINCFIFFFFQPQTQQCFKPPMKRAVSVLFVAKAARSFLMPTILIPLSVNKWKKWNTLNTD